MNENEILTKIMFRIRWEKKRGQLRRRLIFFSFITLSSAMALAPAFRALWLEVSQSGIISYFSFLFSLDLAAVISLGSEFGLSILEILPVMTIVLFLSVVLAFLFSLSFLARDYGRFRALVIN
jgi:hypothetical protein